MINSNSDCPEGLVAYRGECISTRLVGQIERDLEVKNGEIKKLERELEIEKFRME